MKAFKARVIAYHNEVTGSRFLLVLERPDGVTYRILIDYGYFQETKYQYLNYVDDLNPETIDVIIVTHNHLDHTGLLPKAVRQGYSKIIYMTEITKDLIGDFLYDSEEQQVESARDMRDRYPNEKRKFKVLYSKENVKKTLNLCQGLGYRKTIEILPDVKLTFWENAHILGAGMVLLQCRYKDMKPFNFLFTGDFKFENDFEKVPEFPKWFRNMELIVFSESTYGTTKRDEIKKCFKPNILEALERKQDILIGVSAQDRMQGILYDFKQFQDEGLIPPEYQICVDGLLGITTNFKYRSILEWYNPSKKDFMPKGIYYINPESRKHIFENGRPKIVIATSGMLNHGPARLYVPEFLKRDNTLIHLVGYAAEGTLARKLLDAKRNETIRIGSTTYQKKSVIKTTREKTSHATKDELIRLINSFTNIRFLGINHGNEDVKNGFCDDVLAECPKVEQVGVINREIMFSFYRSSVKQGRDAKIVVKSSPTGLLNDSKLVFGKEASSEEIYRKRQMIKAQLEKQQGCSKKIKRKKERQKTRPTGGTRRKKQN